MFLCGAGCRRRLKIAWLTEPGLAGIVAAVKEGRVTFQRILSYTLNSITKKTVQVLFLAIGLTMTGQAILTPLLMVLTMITGDFLGMSLATDNVRPSPMPNVWRIGNLTVAGVIMGLGELVFCTSVLAFGTYGWGSALARCGRWLLSSSYSATRRRCTPIVSIGICGRRVPASGPSFCPSPIF